MQGSGDVRSDSTSSAVSPLFRGVRRWRVHVEKAPVLHLVGGSEALMAKRLAYLTGLPAHPRLRTLEGQRGAGRQLRSCQPQNKPFSSWEQRREVSRCPGQSRHTPPPQGERGRPAERLRCLPHPVRVLGHSQVSGTAGFLPVHPFPGTLHCLEDVGGPCLIPGRTG